MSTESNEPLLSWDDAATMEPVRSEADLVRRLAEIAAVADRPPLVEDGSSLAIGVGQAYSVVTYLRSVGEPDELSRGDVAPEEPVVFSFHGADSEFPPDAAVPIEDALDAMRSFYRTGERPAGITWRTD